MSVTQFIFLVAIMVLVPHISQRTALSLNRVLLVVGTIAAVIEIALKVVLK